MDSIQSITAVAERIWRAGLRAVDAYTVTCEALEQRKSALRGRVFLVAVGKAGAKMALAAEQMLGERLAEGLAVVKRGHVVEGLEKTVVLEAGHPEPDEDGLQASRRVIEFLNSRVGEGDSLLLLISGGGSALLPAPVPGVSLEDKQETTRLLLRCGADIHELNAIRKHLSRLKGGRLLDHVKGRVLTLLISDVVGDDPSVIASGLTAPDSSTFRDCLRIVRGHGISGKLPQSVRKHLERGGEETPKEGDKRFRRVENVIVADNRMALLAAAEAAGEGGFEPLVLTSLLEGSTREAARFHVAVAREALQSGHPAAPPCCVISGGETTVEVTGDGLGGRNQEFALWCARFASRLDGDRVLFASVGTDGSDGPTDAAGAWATPSTGRLPGVREALDRNDSYHFFQKAGQLIKTGPTLTNVMDLRLVLCQGDGSFGV